MKTTLRIVLISVFMGHYIFNVSAQDVNEIEMKPMNEEAFQVLTQFFQYDKHVPLDAIVIDKVENEYYTREKIVFTGFRGSRAVGYLAIPKSGAAPYPCVLQMHGGVSMGKEVFWPSAENPYTDIFTTEGLLKSGIAILTLDAQLYGERTMNNDYKSGANDFFRDLQVYECLDIIVKSTIEYRRAIDYLETLSKIDASRIGASGGSMGGMMTFYLSAVEPRVKAAAPHSVPLKIYGVGTNKLYDYALPSVLAPWHYAKAIAERPFLMMNSTSDRHSPEHEVRKLFDMVSGDSKTLKFYHYEQGHGLPKEHAKDAVLWFTENL